MKLKVAIFHNLPIDIMFRFLIRDIGSIIIATLRIIKGAILGDTKSIRLSGSFLKGNFAALRNIPKMLKKEGEYALRP